MTDQTAALTPEEIEEFERRRAAFLEAGECIEHFPDGSIRLYGAAVKYGEAGFALLPRLLARLEEAEALLERALRENMEMGTIEADIRAHLGARRKDKA